MTTIKKLKPKYCFLESLRCHNLSFSSLCIKIIRWRYCSMDMAGSYSLRAMPMLGQTQKGSHNATKHQGKHSNVSMPLLGILDKDILSFSSFWKAHLAKYTWQKKCSFQAVFLQKKASFTRHTWQKRVLFDIRLSLRTRETVLALRCACDRIFWKRCQICICTFFRPFCQTTDTFTELMLALHTLFRRLRQEFID